MRAVKQYFRNRHLLLFRVRGIIVLFGLALLLYQNTNLCERKPCPFWPKQIGHVDAWASFLVGMMEFATEKIWLAAYDSCSTSDVTYQDSAITQDSDCVWNRNPPRFALVISWSSISQEMHAHATCSCHKTFRHFGKLKKNVFFPWALD